jgi:subtilisin family serine protease
VHFVSIAFRGDPPTTADAVGALLEVERLQTVGVYIPVVNCSWRHALGVCRDDLKEEAAVIGTLQSHTLLVCAAGNDGSEIMPPKQVAGPVTSAADSDPCAKTSKAAVTSTIVAPVYPAAFKTEFGNVISITSCDRRGAPIESATNYGTSYVDLAAPGERVYTTRRQNPWYGYVSGSSIACSFVSGAAALLALKYDEDKFPAKDVRTQLCKAATQSAAWQKDAKEIYCHGAIDFAGLVATP